VLGNVPLHSLHHQLHPYCYIRVMISGPGQLQPPSDFNAKGVVWEAEGEGGYQGGARAQRQSYGAIRQPCRRAKKLYAAGTICYIPISGQTD
jgi:hypothetical protein